MEMQWTEMRPTGRSLDGWSVGGRSCGARRVDNDEQSVDGDARRVDNDEKRVGNDGRARQGAGGITMWPRRESIEHGYRHTG